MKDMPKISNAEWKIMEVLWDKPPLAAKEIVNALEAENWSYTTIMTLISRLVKKGAVCMLPENNANLYCAAVDRQNCVKQETQHLLNKVFKGSVKDLIANFIDNEKLTDKEINEIRELLNREDRDDRRSEN